MKRIFLTLSLIILFAAAELTYGQLARDSWTLGFGFSYPRFVSSDVRPDDASYGGYIAVQRNFFEDVGLRLKASYRHINATIPSSFSPAYPLSTEVPSNVITGSLDMLYYFNPCSPVSPYMGMGAGVAYYDPDWGKVVNPQAESKADAQFNILFGSEWRLGETWNLSTEIGFHSLPSELDGIINNNRQGILGSNADAYVTVDIGLQWYFSKGEPSKICDLYEGIKVKVPEMNIPSLQEIEDVARRYAAQPTTVDYNRIEDIIKKYPCKTENWVLVGVNFEFDKAELLPESYPILEHAAETLKENPDMKVEIQGHTDNIGSEEYNQGLSERRAAAVRDYLAAKGISSARLTTVGYGESRPVSDNGTAMGRAKNRRVEFKVQ